jgi:hypothetical protein
VLHSLAYYTCSTITTEKPREIGTIQYWNTTRLEQHNVGENRSTARQRPWKLKLCIAFEIRKLASEFERYLKSGSGHSFANRHF